MSKKSKALSLGLSLMLCLTLILSACSKNDNGNKDTANNTPANETKNNAAASNTDNSAAADNTAADNTEKPQLDKVTLKFVLLGEAPKDNEAVMAEVNKKLEADINATIELTYIPFADINTKYPLVLASPQDWDVIFGNVNYGSNASKGGYHEITIDDVNKFMPLTASATSEGQWTDARVNGKIYMIPQTFKELDVGTGFYREDLRKKYNVPEIKTFKDLGPYFQALKDNEKGMLPVDGSASDIQGIFGGLMKNYVLKEANYVTGFFPDDPSYTITGLFDDAFKAKFIDAAKTMKDWADKGLLPKNAFAQKTAASDLAKEGKSGYWANAFENYAQYSSDMIAKGWELGAVNNLTDSGVVMTRPATGNGFAFSPKTKNYERALMAIDLLHQDKAYNMLLAFGIEGKNYTLNGDGKLVVAQADPNPYPMYGAGWWSNNRDQWPPLESYTQQYIDTKKALLEKAAPYLLNGFNIDTTNIKTELANIVNIDKQYSAPIQMGLVKDVDAAVADLIERYKKAGAEKVIEEVKKQAAAFVASKQAQ
ncbi:ABC transporter substrate-binding protein [Paenibacillus lignilyticus]|uniref:ABC transporter substrate-binding protein n=1 Tax=Paenibacillus lignilyticus TaxID=1172615 RepID=A0ABS5C702_9BACL|nr:ABC transporter substrate-binding protein [Paenibacillus lignilyticus]MBP3961781.1 ABC transporter substrate-binding protein [Paenibacillus lignilyticus]MBP3963548.1 ABC transporter substrate-binding protein [Paenibacillus lignilyticus]